MDLSSPIHSFSLLVKWLHIFIMAMLFIDQIDPIRNCLPESFHKLMTACLQFNEICLFNCQKNNSTGAISGQYCGNNIQDHFVSAKHLLTSLDQWTEELSKINKTCSSWMPIAFLIWIVNARYTRQRNLILLFHLLFL